MIKKSIEKDIIFIITTFLSCSVVSHRHKIARMSHLKSFVSLVLARTASKQLIAHFTGWVCEKLIWLHMWSSRRFILCVLVSAAVGVASWVANLDCGKDARACQARNSLLSRLHNYCHSPLAAIKSPVMSSRRHHTQSRVSCLPSGFRKIHWLITGQLKRPSLGQSPFDATHGGECHCRRDS